MVVAVGLGGTLGVVGRLGSRGVVVEPELKKVVLMGRETGVRILGLVEVGRRRGRGRRGRMCLLLGDRSTIEPLGMWRCPCKCLYPFGLAYVPWIRQGSSTRNNNSAFVFVVSDIPIYTHSSPASHLVHLLLLSGFESASATPFALHSAKLASNSSDSQWAAAVLDTGHGPWHFSAVLKRLHPALPSVSTVFQRPLNPQICYSEPGRIFSSIRVGA